MKVIIIAAVGRNLEIGKDNDLPWHLPADMKFFRETTTGYPILTGRKNYESIPEQYRPLKNRLNIVLTRSNEYDAAGAVVINTVEEAEAIVNLEELNHLFVIGGGEVYKMFLEQDLVDEMYLTHVENSFDAETYFPEFDPSKWNTKEIKSHPADDKNPYDFKIVHYTKK